MPIKFFKTIIYKFTRHVYVCRWNYLIRIFFPIKKSTFLGLHIIRPYLRYRFKALTENFSFLFQQTGGGKSFVFPEFIESIGSISKNSVAGYVPYIPNVTEIVIYNFFSINYGIRKCFIGQISIIKNQKVVATRIFSLASRAVFNVNLSELFSGIDGDIAVVCLFHPRLSSNHGLHDGHLRFWGFYGNSAITHSMPFPDVLPFRPRERVSNRGSFGLAIDSASSTCAFSVSFYGKFKESACDFLTIPRPLGFHVLLSNDVIRSVWHGSVDDRVKGSPINASQMVAIPDIDNVDVKISFFEAIIESADCNFSLIKKNGVELESMSLKVTNRENLLASSLFTNKIQGNNLVVEIPHSSICGSGYLNLQYFIGSYICDTVHSHRLENFIVKDIVESPSFRLNALYPQINQGLKFIPFRAAKGVKVWLMVWGWGAPYDIRIRLISAMGDETVVSVLLKARVVEHFLLNEMFPQFFDSYDCWCTVQLESDYANSAASLFSFNGNLQSLAIDHLTGG
jgi:hypothetical protein